MREVVLWILVSRISPAFWATSVVKNANYYHQFLVFNKLIVDGVGKDFHRYYTNGIETNLTKGIQF